jgi:hypothetical protein
MLDFKDVDFCWKSNSGKYFMQKRAWVGVGFQIFHIEISENVFYAWEVF